MIIYKDYKLKGGVLSKTKMKSNHLLYKPPYSGTPAIDAWNVWLPHRHDISLIKFTVKYDNGDKETFQVDKATFEEHRDVIDLGFGTQYALSRSYWTISKKTSMDDEQPIVPEVEEEASEDEDEE